MTTSMQPEIDWSAFPDRDDDPTAKNLGNVAQMMQGDV